MKTPDPATPSPCLAFQPILTRLIDSIEGYRLAADLSDDREFIRFCHLRAEAREVDVEELASAIAETGASPSMEGSRSAAVHRAWIRLSCLTFPAARGRLPAECLRGEMELRRLLRRTDGPAARTARIGRLLEELRYDLAIHLGRLRALRAGVESTMAYAGRPYAAS